MAAANFGEPSSIGQSKSAGPWNIVRELTNPRRAAVTFVVALLAVYAALPLAVYTWVEPSPYLVELALLVCVSSIAILIGNASPVLDARFRSEAFRVPVNIGTFHTALWVSFVIYVAITFATAPSIPIVSALGGGSVQDLNTERGEFLKGREGIESVLLYLSAIYANALLPFSLARLYLDRSPWRHALAIFFLGFAISFLVKALFISVIVPIIYASARRGNAGGLNQVAQFAFGFGLLVLMTKLAFGEHGSFDAVFDGQGWDDYFSSRYVSSGTVDFILWRMIAVPMFTAADTVLVFDQELGRNYAWGATSNFLALLFGLEAVPLEKMVYAYQFGANALANSNAVFVADLFVNFGWVGLVVVSFLIGLSFRLFSLSSDEGLRSQWLIYCYLLFGGSAVGTMLSNGFILVLMALLFVRFNAGGRSSL